MSVALAAALAKVLGLAVLAGGLALALIEPVTPAKRFAQILATADEPLQNPR